MWCSSRMLMKAHKNFVGLEFSLHKLSLRKLAIGLFFRFGRPLLETCLQREDFHVMFLVSITSSGCPVAWLLKKKQENRKLRIEKIRKIGNFVLRNRRKIGRSVALSSTKIGQVIIKATSLQLVRSQDLDHLSQLRRSENDQKSLVYRLSYTVIGMICLTTNQVWFYNQR